MKKRIKKKLVKKVSSHYYLPSVIPHLYSYHSLVKYSKLDNSYKKRWHSRHSTYTRTNYMRVHQQTVLQYKDQVYNSIRAVLDSQRC